MPAPPSRCIPDWQLPPGVSPGTWDYTQKESIADDYDDYFACHPLFDLDEAFLSSLISEDVPQTIADLGCGTGRALLPLLRQGHRGIAVDLSQSMLDIVQAKCEEEQLAVSCVRANLVQLDCLPDASVDVAISLFSTLGMIRGRSNRIAALGHAKRILRPRGKFLLHVHNTWAAFWDPSGPWWLLRSWTGSFSRGNDFGDRTYQYRGLPNMFLHNYRANELRRDLTRGGFGSIELYPINRTASENIRLPKLFPSVRAGGFIVVASG